MGAVTSPCLRVLVDDFVVLGARTGWMPQALTSCKAGLLLGKWEKLLWFLPWTLCV